VASSVNGKRKQPVRTGPSRALRYGRTSTLKQNEEGAVSIPEQALSSAAHVERQGYLDLGFVFDTESGGTMDRTEWQQLVARCRRGEVEVICCAKVDRYSRDLLSGLTQLAELQALGVKVEYCDLVGLDTSTANGEAFLHMRLVWAAMEKRVIKERMAGGAHGKAKDGRWPSSDVSAPWAYKVVRDPGDPSHQRRSARLAIDEKEAEVARAAADLILDEGKSVVEAADVLNARGLLPRGNHRKGPDGITIRTPGLWNSHSLRAALSRETLTGKVVWGGGRYATRDVGTGNLVYGGGVEIPGVPPVIGGERWEALQQAMKVHGPRGETNYYPWTGAIESKCGKVYVGTYRENLGGRAYRCQNKRWRGREHVKCDCPWLRADEVDSRLWKAVCDRLGDPAAMIALAREHLAIQEGRTAGAEGERAELVAQAKRRREAMQSNAQAMFAAGIEPQTVAATMKAEQDAVLALERRATDIAAFLADGKVRSDALDQVAKLAEFMAGRLPSLDPEEQRMVIVTLGLTGVLEDPADRNSPITVTSREGAAALLAELGETTCDGDQPQQGCPCVPGGRSCRRARPAGRTCGRRRVPSSG